MHLWIIFIADKITEPLKTTKQTPSTIFLPQSQTQKSEELEYISNHISQQTATSDSIGNLMAAVIQSSMLLP